MTCPAPNPTPRLGVVGILSTENRTSWRTAIRDSWLSGGESSGILARFVLRGVAAATPLHAEATQHGDMVLVRAASSLGRSSGPLASLLLWYECALTAWPNAELVGKADDDVWVSLPSAAAMLRHALGALRSDAGSPPTGLLWGQFESYSWDVQLARPTRHSHYLTHDRKGLPACTTRHEPRAALLARSAGVAKTAAEIVGPFPFPKGPLFFASAALVRQLLGDRRVARLHARALASVNESAREAIKPWEDVRRPQIERATFTSRSLARACPD